MTVQLTLPQEIEQLLIAEVNAGRHPSVEAAILERLSRCEDADLFAAAAMDPDQLRQDLDDAWNHREHAVDGEAFFDRIAHRSESLKSQGK